MKTTQNIVRCVRGGGRLCLAMLVEGIIAEQLSSASFLLELISEAQAAAFLRYEPRSLQGLRLKGGGPIFISPNSKIVRYRRLDLIKWSDRQARENTSQAPGAVCADCPLLHSPARTS